MNFVHINEDVEEVETAAAGAAVGKLSAFMKLETVWEALASKDTVLLRGSWLRELGDTGQVLPRRQDLPQRGAWEPLELQRAVVTRRVAIGAVSYCWLTWQHPDPSGHQETVFKTGWTQLYVDPCTQSLPPPTSHHGGASQTIKIYCFFD